MIKKISSERVEDIAANALAAAIITPLAKLLFPINFIPAFFLLTTLFFFLGAGDKIIIPVLKKYEVIKRIKKFFLSFKLS